MSAEEGLDEEANMYFLLKRYANYARIVMILMSLVLFAGLIVILAGIQEYTDIAFWVSICGGCGLIVSYILMKLFKAKAQVLRTEMG
jgi:hypothetical protein